MKRTVLFSMTCLAVIFFTACVPVRVGKVDLDSDAVLDKYKTYRIADIKLINETELEPQKENISKLIKAIKTEMLARGFRQAQEPDLFINIGITMAEAVTTRETTIQDAPRYIGQRSYHWESEEIVVNRYEEGTAVLDVVDTKENKLIWEGAAIGTLSKKEDKMEKRINLAIAKLFKKFPFTPGN